MQYEKDILENLRKESENDLLGEHGELGLTDKEDRHMTVANDRKEFHYNWKNGKSEIYIQSTDGDGSEIKLTLKVQVVIESAEIVQGG